MLQVERQVARVATSRCKIVVPAKEKEKKRGEGWKKEMGGWGWKGKKKKEDDESDVRKLRILSQEGVNRRCCLCCFECDVSYTY